ncbi:MAG: acyltransferase family protein [Gammaproteobacteria bacterium]
MKYRAEIDGLRALAVMPVILFHAGIEGFSGGFVGVDVFFVISGYLITTIIISEMAEGQFSIVNFYERRARRILPALFFVMAVCIPFAWYFMLPSQLKEFGDSLVSVSLFVSNIYFWLGSGYFAIGQTENPLLHTWSLAVEEQFYIFFPLFLIIFWKLGLRRLIIFLLIIFLISFGIANWAAFFGWHQKITAGGFFLIPTRAWELLIGSFLAFYLKFYGNRIDNFWGELLSFSGLMLIIVSIVFFDRTTPFPSIYTLVPVLGTGLLILSSSDAIVQKFLRLQVIVGLGLISYSAYLWHQPIFAFAHIAGATFSNSLYLSLILISLFLAYISWRFIEKPFRNRSIMSKKVIFTFSSLGILIFISLGSLFSSFNGFAERSPHYAEIKRELEWPNIYNRTEECINLHGGDQYCLISDIQREPTHLLLGDSHANHFYFGLKKVLIEGEDKNLLMTGAGGCPPLIGIDMGYTYVHGSDLKCYERTNEHFLNLLNNYKIEHVYLAFDEAGLFDNKILPKDLLGQFDFEIDRYYAVKGALIRTLEFYENQDISVTLIEDIPDSTFDKQFIRCVWTLNSINECIDDLKLLDNHSSYSMLLDELSDDGFHVLRTNETLKTYPLIGKDITESLYRDSTHLSKYGSEIIVQTGFSLKTND